MGSPNLIPVGVTLDDLRRAVRKLASLRLNADATPTFASQTISGLTAGLHINSIADVSTTLLTLESDIDNANEYNEILFKVVGGLDYGAIRSHLGATGDSYMTFSTTTDGSTLVQHMTIQHDGKIGIRTTSPQRELHITSTGWAEIRLDGSSGGVLEFYNGATALASIYSESANKNLIFRTNGATEQIRILSNGNVGISEIAPETLLEMTSTVPYLTLHNSTEENGDGGRESRINFKGEQDGTEETTLARIEVSHDGAVDDEKGKIILSVNTGALGDSPVTALTVASDLSVTFGGNLIIPDDGYIGSASDTDAIQINSAGNVALTQIARGIFPIAGDDLATKEYVDLAIGSSFDLFLSDTDDGAVADTHVMYSMETGEEQSTEPSPSLSDGPDQLALSWLSEAGVPGTSTLREGVYDCHIHLNKNSGGAATTVYWKLSYVDANGSSGKILVCTSETSSAITTSGVGYDLHAVVATEIPLGATKRLLFEIYVNIAVGQNVILTATLEGTHNSHISFMLPSSIWQHQGDVLDDLNTIGQVGADSEFLVGTGAETFAWESGNTVRTSLGLSIDSDVQAYDAGLASLAGLTYAAASFVKMTGTDTFALRTIAQTADDLEGTIDHGNLANLTIVAHDTTATGTNLTSLTDDSMVDALHRHSELSASDGTPNQALIVDAAGLIGIGPISSMLAPLNITGDTAGIDDRHEGLWMRSKENAWIVQLNVRGPRLEIGGGASLDTTPAMSVNYNTGKVGIGVIPVTRLTVEGTITLKEQAAADGDTADYGQFWVKDTSPNQAYFTDDTGVDHQLRIGAITQTINLLDSDNSAAKQAKIDAVPRYIPFGISVTFQFETSNIHVETASLSWIGFYGGGNIFIYGDITQGTALHSTQNTVIRSIDVAGSALVFFTNSVSIQVRNLKVIVNSSAGYSGIAATNCFGLFQVFYNWFIETGSTNLSNGISFSTCIAMNATRNYFTGFKYGSSTSYGNGFLRDCEFLTTRPTRGTYSTNGANVGIRGNEVLGTTSDRLEQYGGRIG